MMLALVHEPLQWILPSEPHPCRNIHDKVIKANEGTEDAEVPPDVSVVDREATPELIPSRVLTELAHTITSDLDIASSLLDV